MFVHRDGRFYSVDGKRVYDALPPVGADPRAHGVPLTQVPPEVAADIRSVKEQWNQSAAMDETFALRAKFLHASGGVRYVSDRQDSHVPNVGPNVGAGDSLFVRKQDDQQTSFTGFWDPSKHLVLVDRQPVTRQEVEKGEREFMKVLGVPYKSRPLTSAMLKQDAEHNYHITQREEHLHASDSLSFQLLAGRTPRFDKDGVDERALSNIIFRDTLFGQDSLIELSQNTQQKGKQLDALYQKYGIKLSNKETYGLSQRDYLTRATPYIEKGRFSLEGYGALVASRDGQPNNAKYDTEMLAKIDEFINEHTHLAYDAGKNPDGSLLSPKQAYSFAKEALSVIMPNTAPHAIKAYETVMSLEDIAIDHTLSDAEKTREMRKEAVSMGVISVDDLKKHVASDPLSPEEERALRTLEAEAKNRGVQPPSYAGLQFDANFEISAKTSTVGDSSQSTVTRDNDDNLTPPAQTPPVKGAADKSPAARTVR